MNSQKIEKIRSKKSWHYRLVKWSFDGEYDYSGHVHVGVISYVLRLISTIVFLPFMMIWYPLANLTLKEYGEHFVVHVSKFVAGLYNFGALLFGGLVYEYSWQCSQPMAPPGCTNALLPLSNAFGQLILYYTAIPLILTVFLGGIYYVVIGIKELNKREFVFNGDPK